MLTLAMILDNPGEQPHPTRYRDPRVLRDLGYTDLIVYSTTGLSGLLGPDTVSAGEMRRWVEEQHESVQKSVAEAAQAGMGVWLTYDAPSLARELVGSAMTCINQNPKSLCPASDELLEMSGQCLEAMLATVKPVEGVVLRLGDNDAAKLPYLLGNDIYAPHCARCSGMGRADRLVRMILYFYELVVQRLGRKLIVRAWNVRPGGMHDNTDVCSRVVERLPEDERLILSFKFTHTDFWRYQQWNPASLNCGDRPIIYELECQREFEAKGAVPDYQVPLWRDGMPEMPGAEGLAEISRRVNLAGLWAWVRGGGWRGPYINRDTETWIDANVVAVPRLAADPRVDAAELAKDWVQQRLKLEDPALVAAVQRVLIESPQTALESFYIGPYAKNHHTPWYPSAHFIQDDQIDAEAAWTIVQHLPDDQLDAVIAEKQAAEARVILAATELRRAAASANATEAVAPLLGSLRYTETLVRTLRLFLTGLVAYRRWLRRPDAAVAASAITHMNACQGAWVEHTQRLDARGTATPFSSDNLWDLSQRVIDELHAEANA